MSDETSHTAAMDMPAHETTWNGFVTFVKWGTIHIVIVLSLLAILVL